MDLGSVKLKPTATVEKSRAATFGGGERVGKKLLEFWSQDEKLDLGSDECWRARAKYFASNVDVIVAALPADVVVPSKSFGLVPRKDLERLASLWGSHASAFLWPEMDAFVRQCVKEMGGRVFVKLGCRSAKDIAFTHERTLSAYHKSLESLAVGGESTVIPRYKRLELLYRAQIDCLCVSSFDEALSLLLESTRVLFDVELDLLGDDLHTTLEVRPWMNASLESEWRCFVRGGFIVAISQYFTDLFFEGLDEAAAQKAITKAWDQSVKQILVDQLSLEKCVVDFMVLNGRALVLEVNQYAKTTGSGLFTWDEIENKPAECEIRVVKQPPADIRNLPEEWTQLLH